MKSPGIHFSLCVRARSRVTWKRSHLLTLQRNILLFPPLTKPSTGKLLAKWALPGHGTTCCPLQFTYPKVTHNSDVKPSWCLNEPSFGNTLEEWSKKSQRLILRWGVWKNTNGAVKRCSLMADSSATGEGMFAEIQVKNVIPQLTDGRVLIPARCAQTPGHHINPFLHNLFPLAKVNLLSFIINV